MKKITFCLIIFFSSIYLFAVPPLPPGHHPSGPGPEHHELKRNYRNFHGKRFKKENGDFKAVIVRSFDISDVVLIEVLFNNPIDAESVHPECIQINKKSIDLNQLRFSKKRNSIRFIVAKESLEETNLCFSFELEKIKSINGNEVIPVKFSDCLLSSEYRFSEREKAWKKF